MTTYEYSGRLCKVDGLMIHEPRNTHTQFKCCLPNVRSQENLLCKDHKKAKQCREKQTTQQIMCVDAELAINNIVSTLRPS
jgi:hypothetical protein